MSSVFITSTMKSPPLDDCDTVSLVGGWASAAVSSGPGTAAFNLALGAAPCAWAAAGVSAAAPTRPAPLRKLRRPRVGESLRRESLRFLGMASSWDVRRMASRRSLLVARSVALCLEAVKARDQMPTQLSHYFTLSRSCPDMMAYGGQTFAISKVERANRSSSAIFAILTYSEPVSNLLI